MNTLPSERHASTRTALGVTTTIFFMWGFITALNDVLIPHLRSMFTLTHAEAMLVQFTFFGAYFLISLPSGKVVSRFGYRGSIISGLVITGIGAMLFIPAAHAQSYALFLFAFFVLASGITLLQVAANPYVSLLGEPERASSRLNLAQALNSLGTTIAPYLGGLLILSTAVMTVADIAELSPAARAAYRVEQAQAVQGPYIGIAVVLFVLAVVVWLFRLPKPEEATSADDAGHGFGEALRHRRVWLGMAAIFVYVGAEVSIGSFMIGYISLPGIGDMSAARAANYVSIYWGGAMVGRFIGSALLTRLDTRKLLAGNAVIAALLVMTTMLTHGPAAVWSIAAIGLFNSIMFPNIFTLGIERFGALTGKVSSLLVMAIVGGAIIPELQGLLADRIGVQHAFVLPLLCYLYIIFYGLKGSRLT